MEENRTRPPRKQAVKLNYRMILCIALLACFVLALLFFILFLVRGSQIGKLNEQVKTLTDEKTALTAQVGTLTQDNQTMLAGLTAALPDPTTAQTNDLTALIPQLTEGVYVIHSTGTQYQYLSVPAGYVQDKLAAYRDDTAAYTAAEGDAPTCSYWVLFSDRVIGVAEGDIGFVSMDRGASGSASKLPSGLYSLVSAMFS